MVPCHLFFKLFINWRGVLTFIPLTTVLLTDALKFTAETEPHEGKRKVESLWPIFRLHHQRSRYIFDLFYKRKAISRGIVVGFGLVVFVLFRDVLMEVVNLLFSFAELYEYCIKEGYADKNLIAKWKKQGYENLCCLRCIQTRDTNFGTNCICRVPKGKLEVVS